MQEESTSTVNSPTTPENTSPNGQAMSEPIPPQKGSEKIFKLKQYLQLKAKGTVKYATDSLGATLASFFALFNAATTINGAAKVLPSLIGVPIGALISVAYFIILTSTKVKAKHPLRRLLLILIFAPASAYTSFFSIYGEMSGGRLEQQAFKEIVKSHNNLLIGIDAYMKQVMSQSDNLLGGRIAQINKLDEEIKEFDENRDEIVPENMKNPGDGNRATKTVKKEKQQERIQNEIQNLPVYKVYEKFRQIRKEYSAKLNALLDEKTLIDDKTRLTQEKVQQNNKSDVKAENKKTLINEKTLIDDKTRLTQIFQQDNKLYSDIKAEIDGILPEEIKQKFKNIPPFEDLKPLEDNYVLIPIFLIPLNSLSNNSKEAKFIWIAVIIAIGMEVIPILLSGIYVISSDPKFYSDPKTVIKQISAIMSYSISNFKELCKEISNAFTLDVSTSALYNMRNDTSCRLAKAMHAAKLETLKDRQEFLREFYGAIDHDLKEIDLSKKIEIDISTEKSSNNGSDKEKEKNFKLAYKLFVDIMHSKKVNWLVKFPRWKQVDRLSIFSNIIAPQTEIMEADNDKIIIDCEKNDKIIIAGKWYFSESAYENFLDWLLEAQNLKEIYMPLENFDAKFILVMSNSFSSNSSPMNSDPDNDNPNGSKKSE